MGIDLPEPLRWLFKLTGSDWPDADEDKIAAFGAGVGGMYDRIQTVNEGITESVRAANLSGSGPAMTQFTGSMREVVGDGLPGMGDGARVMAEEIHAAALQAEYSKGTAVINMAIMAPMIIDAIAAAPETFGASMAVAEAGIAAVRTTVPKLLGQMVEKVVTNTAMMEAGDLAVQGYQILIKHDRSGFDGKLALNTVEMGAIGGAVDGLLTGVIMKGAPKYFKTSEAGVKDADKLIWAPPKWVNMGTQAANNTVTSLIMAGINGEPIDGKSLLEGAGIGMLFGGLARTGGGVKIKPFDTFHMSEDFHTGDTWIRPNGAYTTDKTGTNDFSFNVRRQPGSGDGTKNVYYGDPNVTHPEGTPPLPKRLGPVIDKLLEDHPEGAPKPQVVVLEHTPPSDLEGIRALAKDKGVDVVVPHGAVENGPNGSIRVPGSDGGSGFRVIRADGTEEHLGPVYDPRQAVGETVVGGVPPVAKISLGSGGEKFVSREVLGDGDCTISSLADSALSQGVSKKSLHAEGLDLSHPDGADLREYRNRLADEVAARSTDTRGGSPVLLGELGPKGARELLGKIDEHGPPKASSSSHIDALDLAVSRPTAKDPVAELTKRLEQDPRRVLSALEDHYAATGDKGMAQLAAYAKAKVENGGGVPQHRDLLDYAIRERTLAETPLGGEMLQAVAHTLGLDVVVVSDKPAFHLNGDAPKRVYVHRVDTGDGRNHYRALHPESTSPAKFKGLTPQRRVPVSSRGGHGAVHRASDGTPDNALHRLAGGARNRADQTDPATRDRSGGLPTTPRPTTPHDPTPDVATLMQQAGRGHGTPAPAHDGFEDVLGPDVMNVRAVPDKPHFLRNLHFDDLPPENVARFFDAVDMARPDGPAWDLPNLFTGSAHGQTPTTIPRVLHSIWLGGPLHDDHGDRHNFMEVMGSNADRTGLTAVLWTDVPRHEIDQVRTLAPDAVPTPRQTQIREMLDWAGRHDVRLANVDEVFAGSDRAELHAQIATERARTTGTGYAGASDLLRIDILHRFGGVYTDGDNHATADLVRFLHETEQDTQHHQFAISSLNGSVNNSAFIAPPRNAIVHEYRENLKDRYATPLRQLLTERAAQGRPERYEERRPNFETSRLDNRDLRTEVINRSGPTSWYYDKLATKFNGENRTWFRTITKDHIEAGSEASWLSDHPQPHTPPAEAVKAAVTVLHREAVNREGVLHLPAVADIIGKAAPEDREHIWHAVLHTMHETWPKAKYPRPDIVVSGRIMLGAGRGIKNQSIPRFVKDYLHDSGLFPEATIHSSVGNTFTPRDPRYLAEDLTKAGLQRVGQERGQDISRVHQLLFGDPDMFESDRTRQAAKILDLLHAASPGDSRRDPLWTAKALRDVVEQRFGADGDYDHDAHLQTLLADAGTFGRRGTRGPDAYRRHSEYSRAVPDGTDPDKVANDLSPQPARRRAPGAKDLTKRWDRAVDTLSLERELRDELHQDLTPEQRRGLWKAVGLYRRQHGNASSERPLTVADLAGFRTRLATAHPRLGAGDSPHEWLRNLTDHLHEVSPVTGRVSIRDLTRHVARTQQEDQHFGARFPEPPATLKWWREDARETLRQFDELGPLVQHLPPARYRDLIHHAGHATEFPQRYHLLKQLHINISHIQPDNVRIAVQGSRFHRRLSDELRRFGPDIEVERRDQPAFNHHAEAAEFRAEYVEMRSDGSGMWIRDPRSPHDMRVRPSATTMRPDPGHFTVTLHGSPDKVHVGKAHLSAADVANLLRHTPEWADDPRPIRMIACNTGEHDHGFAQQLADHLGVEVKAPNTVVWGTVHGKPYASTLVYRPDGTMRPVKEVDGAYRVFTPHTRNPDGTVRPNPVRLDTSYEYLGRKPALTVLSRAVAGPFGDALAGRDPVARKIIDDWRHLMGQTGGTSEKAFQVSESARDALDKVLTPDTVQWMFRYAPPGSEVNQALHVLTGSRIRAQHGGRDEQPAIISPRSSAYARPEDSGHGAPSTVGPVDEHARRTRAEYAKTGERPVSELIQSSHLNGKTVDQSARELVDRIQSRTYTSRPPTAHEVRTLVDVLTVAEDIGFKPDFFPPGAHLAELKALWKAVETHREVLPAHSAALERPIRFEDLEHLGRQLGHRQAADEAPIAWVRRLSTDVDAFRAAHPGKPLSASAMAHRIPDQTVQHPKTSPPPPSPPRTEVSDAEARTLSDALGGHVPVEAIKKLSAVQFAKFPTGRDPRREPRLSDFRDLVHQLLGPDHELNSGIATLAAAATRARKEGSLSSLDAALLHDPGDFVREPWSQVRYELHAPWADRHVIERDAALLYYRAFGTHVPARPDAATVRDMRRAVQVAKLAHSSYDRRGQADPDAFYRDLGSRLRPLRGETGAPSDPFHRLLHAAGSGDTRRQNPDFLAAPIRDRLHGPSTPRPPLGHDVPPADTTRGRDLAAKLPGLFTATGFGGHEHLASRLRALIPGRGPLRFEVGLPTELREGFGAMVDGGLTLRVTRDGHAYDVHLKALLKSAPEAVEESGGKAKNESRFFRTGDDGGGAHGTSRTLTVDAGLKTGYGPGSVGANIGTSRIRSREVTSSESYGGDIYLDPSDGTHRHTLAAEVHIEVTDPATGHWAQDVPRAGDPPHTVELRIQDHLTATEGFDSAPKKLTKALDDSSIDLLLGERTGYGDPLKRDFLQLLHDSGLTLDEKARGDVDAYFSDLASPHNIADLHSADPLRRAGLTTEIQATGRDGRRVAISLGAHAEAETLAQVSASRAGLKMDTVTRHTVKQGVSTGRGGGLPSSLTGSVKAPDGKTNAGLGVSGNSTRTETSSLESAYTVTRTVRAEDENASYRLVSKVDLHVAVDGKAPRTFSADGAPAWIRLRTADHARLVAEDGAGPRRPAAEEDAGKLDPRLVTPDGLPLGQVKEISNLDGLYKDLTAKLSAHLPEEASQDLAKLFHDDPTGSFLHGEDDAHRNWRRIVAAVAGPALGQRADALTGEGVTVPLRIGGRDVPLRLAVRDLDAGHATSLGTDPKLMPISVHQASQATRLRSTRQQDLSFEGSLGVGKNNGLFKAVLTGRETKAARSTVSGGTRQYTRSNSGSELFDVKGRLHWKLESDEHPLEGSVAGGLHLWVSSDLVKTASGLDHLPALRPLPAREHSPLIKTPIHMAVTGGGLDKLRAEVAKHNPALADAFGTGRFAAQLPLLAGGGVRVAPGVHWDVTPTGRPQVLRKIEVYVESHGEAGTAVDHDLETRSGKGGSGFGGGSGSGLAGGATVSHSRDTARGSNTGGGESSTRLMTAKTVPMALVRTEVRHRVTGVDGRPVETTGETLVLVPLTELHGRLEHFDFPVDGADHVFEGFTGPGRGEPSPALEAGMLFGPVGAHPDGGLGLEAAAKAREAFGDRDLDEQVRDLLQTPTLASQIRKLSDGGLTHPIVTESGGRYELRIQAEPVGRPVLHSTNATGGAKMYNAASKTSNERGGTSKTTTGAATAGIETPVLSLSGTHSRSATRGDVETRARRDVESEGLRFSGESMDEYRQDVEYKYTVTRISHPLWNLHFGDRPPEALRKSVGGSYVAELRVFEPKTLKLEPTGEHGALADDAVPLDWHGQEKVTDLFREFGGSRERHAPPDAKVFSKGTFTSSLHDILKPGGAEFHGADLGGRTLTTKHGVRIEGKLNAPKSIAYLKAGAERESFSHREVASTTEHATSTKKDTKGQVSVSGVTPTGVTVGGRFGVGHAGEQREKTTHTQSAETRPRWDRQPGALYAVHVPVELTLDFGRGAPKHTTVDVLVHVDEAGARELGISDGALRTARGEAPEPQPQPQPHEQQHEQQQNERPQNGHDQHDQHDQHERPVDQPEPPVDQHQPPVDQPEPPVDQHEQPVDQPEPPPLDDATRQALSSLTPDQLTELENLARARTAEEFQELSLRAALSPGHADTALLERVPGLLSRDHALQAVHAFRTEHPPVPTHDSVASLIAPFAEHGVSVRVIPAGTTIYRAVDIRTALAHLNGAVEARNRPGWMQLGRGLYTSPTHDSAAIYRDRPDKVMLRMTLTRDMVGMDVAHDGGNVDQIGRRLGERHEGVAQVSEAGARLMAGSDFVSVHHPDADPYEIKFHEGAFGDFAIEPEHGFPGFGDGVHALYGDWSANPTDLPLRATEVLARLGTELDPQLLWHQVTAEHVRAAAAARGLPPDQIRQLHDRVLAEPGSLVQPHLVEWGATIKHGAEGSIVTDVDNRFVVKVPTPAGVPALRNEAHALRELHNPPLPGAKIVELLHTGPAEIPVERGEAGRSTVVGPVVVLRKADGALNDPGFLTGLTPRERTKLAVDLIDTVHALHQANWTHGDIGLKNTLHDRRPGTGVRSVLADFGAASHEPDAAMIGQDRRDLFKTVYNILTGDHRDNWLTAADHRHLDGPAEDFFQGHATPEHLTPAELKTHLRRLFPDHFQDEDARARETSATPSGVVSRGEFPPPHRLTPESIGDLPVSQRFARGAMGEVFRTEHEGRGYAVKQPTAEGLADFRNEISNLIKIDDRHPDGNFAKYRGHVDDDATGRHRLVLDLADTSLERLMADGGLTALPLAERARMARDLISAVRAMHAMDLSHNDINPKNVLVSEVGGHQRAVLTDFGSTGPSRLSAADIDKALEDKAAEIGIPVEYLGDMRDDIIRGLGQDRAEIDRAAVAATVGQILGLDHLDPALSLDELEQHLRDQLPGDYPDPVTTPFARGGGAHGDREPFHDDELTALAEHVVKTFPNKPNHLLLRDPEHPRAGELESTSRALPEEHGYFTVDAHGGPDGVHLGDRRLTVEQLARIIEADPHWQRTRSPIRLASCDTGRDPRGFAQQLAHRLGVEVKAPTDKLWVSHRGDTFVTGHHYAEDGTVRPVKAITGSWHVFSPHEGTGPRVDTADLHAGDGIDEAALDTLRSFSEDDLARLQHLAETMTPEEIQRLGRQAVLSGVDHPDVELLSRIPPGLSPEKAVRAARAAHAAFDSVARTAAEIAKAEQEYADKVGKKLEELGWKLKGGGRTDVYYLPKGADYRGDNLLSGQIAASQVHPARSYATQRDRQALRWLASAAMNRLEREGLEPHEVQAGLTEDGHLYISANVDKAGIRLESLLNGDPTDRTVEQTRRALQDLFPDSLKEWNTTRKQIVELRRRHREATTSKQRTAIEKDIRGLVRKIGGKNLGDLQYRERMVRHSVKLTETVADPHSARAQTQKRFVEALKNGITVVLHDKNGTHAEIRIAGHVKAKGTDPATLQVAGVKRPCAVCATRLVDLKVLNADGEFSIGPAWASGGAFRGLTDSVKAEDFAALVHQLATKHDGTTFTDGLLETAPSKDADSDSDTDTEYSVQSSDDEDMLSDDERSAIEDLVEDIEDIEDEDMPIEDWYEALNMYGVPVPGIFSGDFEEDSDVEMEGAPW
ncbi:serine/threonine-protein kinase [Catenulispora subtropica]|uniref:Protein kinase domain-containing protein n=1 Tax=Catenulispora subtropica TaxID=450798 RepID=A0ABN2SYZ1_9ACTN